VVHPLEHKPRPGRELIRLARRSGLLHINVGIESIRHETLKDMNKKTTSADRMGELIRILRDLDVSFFTAEELEKNILWMYREFYSWPSILRRLPLPRSKASIASWFMNFSQRKMVRSEESRTNFDGV
jgi:hypothetical protein